MIWYITFVQVISNVISFLQSPQILFNSSIPLFLPNSLMLPLYQRSQLRLLLTIFWPRLYYSIWIYKVLDFIKFQWLYWLTQSFHPYKKYNNLYEQPNAADLGLSNMTSASIYVSKKLSDLMWHYAYKVIQFEEERSK